MSLGLDTDLPDTRGVWEEWVQRRRDRDEAQVPGYPECGLKQVKTGKDSLRAYD